MSHVKKNWIGRVKKKKCMQLQKRLLTGLSFKLFTENFSEQTSRKIPLKKTCFTFAPD